MAHVGLWVGCLEVQGPRVWSSRARVFGSRLEGLGVHGSGFRGFGLWDSSFRVDFRELMAHYPKRWFIHGYRIATFKGLLSYKP